VVEVTIATGHKLLLRAIERRARLFRTYQRELAKAEQKLDRARAAEHGESFLRVHWVAVLKATVHGAPIGGGSGGMECLDETAQARHAALLQASPSLGAAADKLASCDSEVEALHGSARGAHCACAFVSFDE
jgi:hypothetical protein